MRPPFRRIGTSRAARWRRGLASHATPDITMSQTAASRPVSKSVRSTVTNSASTPRSCASCKAISTSKPTRSPCAFRNTYGGVGEIAHPQHPAAADPIERRRLDGRERRYGVPGPEGGGVPAIAQHLHPGEHRVLAVGGRDAGAEHRARAADHAGRQEDRDGQVAKKLADADRQRAGHRTRAEHRDREGVDGAEQGAESTVDDGRGHEQAERIGRNPKQVEEERNRGVRAAKEREETGHREARVVGRPPARRRTSRRTAESSGYELGARKIERRRHDDLQVRIGVDPGVLANEGFHPARSGAAAPRTGSAS